MLSQLPQIICYKLFATSCYTAQFTSKTSSYTVTLITNKFYRAAHSETRKTETCHTKTTLSLEECESFGNSIGSGSFGNSIGGGSFTHGHECDDLIGLKSVSGGSIGG